MEKAYLSGDSPDDTERRKDNAALHAVIKAIKEAGTVVFEPGTYEPIRRAGLGATAVVAEATHIEESVVVASTETTPQ